MTDTPKPILMQYQPQDEHDRLDILGKIDSPLDKSTNFFLGFWLYANRVKLIDDEPIVKQVVGQPPPLPSRPRFWSGPGGALLVDREITGVTQDLTRGQGYEDTMRYYGGRYFVGETITRDSARRLAAALGGDYFTEPPSDVRERIPALPPPTAP